MKKILSAKIQSILGGALVLPLLLCACGSGIKAASANVSEAAAAVAYKMSAAEAPSAAGRVSGSGGGQSVSDAAQSGIPHLILSKCYLLESENYENIADGYYQAVLLTEESAAQFPALGTGLAELNTKISRQCTEDFKKLAEDARQFLKENTDEEAPVPGALESSIIPLRQDGRFLSFFISCYSYTPGAAHGITSFTGYTLDSATGRQVQLDSVITDRDALIKAISDNLFSMATGEPAGDRESAVRECFDTEGYSPSWVISNSGILVRFAPYEIGTYAEGPFEAEISFRKYPDLFTDTFSAHTGAYTLPVGMVYPVSADLDGDGTSETLSINARPSDDGNTGEYTALRVAAGDKECLYETFFYTARGILIHGADKKNYMYVQLVTDNDYPTIAVFDLNGNAPVFVGELSGTGLSARYRQEDAQSDVWYHDEQLISDPGCFSLDTRMNLMSTYSATRSYKLGSDGMPVPLSEYYTINNDFELISLKPLTADVVDSASGAVTKAGVSIPVGTKFRFFRTNGTNIVDLVTDGGTLYRFTVEGVWPQIVNGTELTEAFDGTMFAG